MRVSLILFALLCSARPSAGEEIIRTGPMRVYGNENIKSYILLREFSLRSGDPFDYAAVQAGKQRLFDVPGVDYADVRMHYVADDSSFGVSVVVTERNTLGGKAWLVRGRENDVSVGGAVYERNLRGRSERLELFAQGIGGALFGLSWENPWLGSGARIGAGLRAAYEQYRYVYDDVGITFEGAKLKRMGAKASVFYSFSKRMRTTVTVGFEHIESSTDSVTTNAGGDDVATIALAVSRDGRDSERFPWSGAYTLASVRGIDPGGSSIFEGIVDARAFVSAFDRAVFGAHARAAYRDGSDIPLYRRDHIGGTGTVRGYDFGEQGGVSSVVAGFEYRLAVNFTRQRPLEDVLLGVAVHAFVDAGAAYENGERWGSDRFISSYGVGLALLNRQVKGLRIDYGWGDNGEKRFDLDFGLKF